MMSAACDFAVHSNGRAKLAVILIQLLHLTRQTHNDANQPVVISKTPKRFANGEHFNLSMLHGVPAFPDFGFCDSPGLRRDGMQLLHQPAKLECSPDIWLIAVEKDKKLILLFRRFAAFLLRKKVGGRAHRGEMTRHAVAWIGQTQYARIGGRNSGSRTLSFVPGQLMTK